MPPLIAQLKKMANSTDTTPLSPSLYSSSPSISVSSSSSNSSPSSPSSPTSSPVSSPVQTRRPRGRPPIYTNNTRNRDLPCLDNTLSSSTKLSKRKLVAGNILPPLTSALSLSLYILSPSLLSIAVLIYSTDENTKESKCARSPQLSPRSSPMSSSPSSSYSVPLSPSSPEYFYTASSTVRRSSLSSSVYPHHSLRMNIPYYPSPPSSPTYISPRTPPYACSPYTPSTPYPTSTFYPPASPYAPSTTYTPSTPSHYNSSYIPQVPHLNPPTLPALSPSASLTLSSSTSLTLPPLLSHHDRETSSFRWEGYRHAIDRGMVDMLSM